MKKIFPKLIALLLLSGLQFKAVNAGDSLRQASGCIYAKYQRLAEIEFAASKAQYIQSKKKGSVLIQKKFFRAAKRRVQQLRNHKKFNEGRVSRCFKA